MQRLWLFLSLLLASTVHSFASDGKPDPRPDMHLILTDIRALEKYLISEPAYLASENENEISTTLEKLNQHLKGLNNRKELFKNAPAMLVNLGMVTEHMLKTEQYFKEKNKQFSRYMLQSGLQMCISCHTRDQAKDLFVSDSEEKSDAVEYGDYLLATRQFTKARDFFERKVSEYPGNKIGTSDLRRSLLNLAVLYTRVKPDPKRAISIFDKASKQSGMPQYLRGELSAWVADFRAWEKTGVEPKKSSTESELLAAAKKLLRSDDLNLIGDFAQKFHVRRLRASVFLHRLLELPGASPRKGEALYLLGLLYNRLQHNLFFHFDEMYLKACIKDYKKTKVAKDCYNSLERILLDGYTGSGGMNLPSEVEGDLIQLKRMAY